jgi:outer membrane protein OmpA-like peptidoglycan-associated protein
MKKLVLFFAAATMALSANAQTVAGSKFTDNWWIGLQGGVMTKTTHNRWLHNINPNFGLRIGKNITPAFGLIFEGNAYLGWRGADQKYGYYVDSPVSPTGADNGQIVGAMKDVHHNFLRTAIKTVNVNLLANINLMNLFGKYQGEPRFFEVSALWGLGWLHSFGTKKDVRTILEPMGDNHWARFDVGGDRDFAFLPGGKYMGHVNEFTQKVALDFQFNLGAKKAFQVFVEPSINWVMPDWRTNIDNSWVQLNAGVAYKFKNSNGTHNFTLVKEYDQDEIDRLNAIINDLRNKPAKIEYRDKIVEKIVEKNISADNIKVVTFAQGKYNITAENQAKLNSIKEGAHVKIYGTASPEGSKEFNDRLSQNRANAVADYLKNRGVIVDEATGHGVEGSTSNRLAIVIVQ